MVGSWARELLGLVLPANCAGCGAYDEVLCSDCQGLLAGPVRRCDDDAARLCPADGGPALPVWTGAVYAGPARAAVSQWKRHGRTELAPLMTAAVRRTAQSVAPAIAEALRRLGDGHPLNAGGLAGVAAADRSAGDGLAGGVSDGGSAGVAAAGRSPDGGVGGPSGDPTPPWPPIARSTGVVVVPIPSRLAARVKRPTSPVQTLVRGVLAGFEAARLPAIPAHVLRRPALARDQVGLASRQRAINREGTTLVRPRRLAAAPPWPVLLVDDVLTTGASLLDAESALARAGCLSLGAIVLAATPPRAATLRRCR